MQRESGEIKACCHRFLSGEQKNKRRFDYEMRQVASLYK